MRTREILGIPISITDYDGAMDVMDAMIERRDPGYVCAVAVHAVMVAQDDPVMKAAVTSSTLTVPDGMPLVWAANMLGEHLPNRVYGPELMERFNHRCVERGHRVWLYGGRDQGSLVQLALSMRRRHPGIQIVGGYSPPFRSLTDEEEDAIVDQINQARPDVLWVGVCEMRPAWKSNAAPTPHITGTSRRSRMWAIHFSCLGTPMPTHRMSACEAWICSTSDSSSSSLSERNGGE